MATQTDRQTGIQMSYPCGGQLSRSDTVAEIRGNCCVLLLVRDLQNLSSCCSTPMTAGVDPPPVVGALYLSLYLVKTAGKKIQLHTQQSVNFPYYVACVCTRQACSGNRELLSFPGE